MTQDESREDGSFFVKQDVYCNTGYYWTLFYYSNCRKLQLSAVTLSLSLESTHLKVLDVWVCLAGSSNSSEGMHTYLKGIIS